MATIRYYPLSRMQTGLQSNGDLYLDGQPYTGPYYRIYTGETFTGDNPFAGSNNPLTPTPPSSRPQLFNPRLTQQPDQAAISNRPTSTEPIQRIGSGKLREVVSYTPIPLETDYARGYFKRYFAKRFADKGYIMEVSEEDWAIISNGEDQRYLDYEVTDMIWQLKGPRHDTRVSQYQVKGGIVDTNKRVTETKAKTFIGLVEFIGGDYTKFARITD